MFFSKIKSKDSGILLYGITPPKIETTDEKLVEIAQRTLARLDALDIDALVVYDVQDESSRTTEERPFPFIGALDPFYFASNYLKALAKPKIIYRPAGKFDKTELSQWLSELVQYDFYPIFVGVPSPDFHPKTSLKEAYELWSQYNETSVIGAITIPERHAVLHDEDVRMIEKMSSGVSYFISQCVFNINYAKDVIDALVLNCKKNGTDTPTIIFTLTACGSPKTLLFMEWLGIHVPDNAKADLLSAENMLQRSVELCLDIANELADYCALHNLPFGFNIESVAIRKDEIEASIYMLNQISEMLKSKGIRK
jgi:hypothetical protein